ncbi:MAG: hypothetical protein U5K71_12795 [Gracilimonas sp.]|nr:hypothetical protein [Gracilimonas sp.]
MEIPDVIAMEASPTHLYVLSETEGMAVFRAYPDSIAMALYLFRHAATRE